MLEAIKFHRANMQREGRHTMVWYHHQAAAAKATRAWRVDNSLTLVK